ncbi:hypothetical protein NDI43_26170 [Microcoleus vaginatus GB2-A3]|uniref:hypothetical protein n=1 Tax=Microcoleus TaxID=44471 RepID=UPI001685AF04|nr:hypothetical protein [Microcoleus sp. FACHB-DQ6]
MENKVFRAKQAQAFRFTIYTNRLILAEGNYNLREILTREDSFNMLYDAAQGEAAMILPASIKMKWKLLATAFICPLTLIGVGIGQQPIEAQQNPSKTNVAALPDGIYLYGDSPQPNQVLQNYIVFQRQNDRVVGAIYAPRSDFACFTGKIQGNTLSGKAISPGGKLQTIEINTQLTNLHSIRTISSNDRRILSTCQQTAQANISR